MVAVPTQVFYDDPEAGRRLVRFAFCKRPEVLDRGGDPAAPTEGERDDRRVRRCGSAG